MPHQHLAEKTTQREDFWLKPSARSTCKSNLLCNEMGRGKEQLVQRLRRRAKSHGIAGTASPKALPANSLHTRAAAALPQMLFTGERHPARLEHSASTHKTHFTPF